MTLVSPKRKAFMELEEMVKPIPPLDYKKELEDAMEAKYGRPDLPDLLLHTHSETHQPL